MYNVRAPRRMECRRTFPGVFTIKAEKSSCVSPMSYHAPGFSSLLIGRLLAAQNGAVSHFSSGVVVFSIYVFHGTAVYRRICLRNVYSAPRNIEKRTHRISRCIQHLEDILIWTIWKIMDPFMRYVIIGVGSIPTGVAIPLPFGAAFPLITFLFPLRLIVWLLILISNGAIAAQSSVFRFCRPTSFWFWINKDTCVTLKIRTTSKLDCFTGGETP